MTSTSAPGGRLLAAGLLLVASRPPQAPSPDLLSTLAVIAIASVGLALVTYVPGAALRIWNERRLRSLARGRLVITFDDGPSPVSTQRILDVLDEFGARATFFVVGHRAAAHPEICDLVRARGHEIGSHSQTHLHAWYRPVRAVLDVLRGCRTASAWTSDSPSFRPPFGKVSLWSYLAVRLSGYRVVVWTLDPQDSLEEVLPLQQVEDLLRRDGGGVVVLHDLDWPGDSARVEFTLAVTRKVLEVGRELGLRTCTMSELFRDDACHSS